MFTDTIGILGDQGSLTLPTAQELMSAPQDLQPLAQPSCNRASHQLLTALPCPAMGSAELDQPTGSCPGLASALRHAHGLAQPSWGCV